jgi:5-methylcytosine-specific restriction endonuclease McrA
MLKERARLSPLLKKWRIKIFQRDFYTCTDCGAKGSKVYLHAHHIKSFSKFPKDRLKKSNGKTVCVPCHEKIHGRKIGLGHLAIPKSKTS